MSLFKHRISYTCPVADIAKANELMAWVGEPGDINTFRAPESGAYSLASGLYKEDFVGRLMGPLSEANRPAWDTENTLSLATAQAGQSALQVSIDEQEPQGEALVAKGKSGKVVASFKGVASGDLENTSAWQSGVPMKVGDLCSHSGITYMCIQAHTTQSDWTPNVVPALFLVIPSDASVWTAGAAYTIGDVVEYQGAQYECRQSHTAQVGWEPPNVLALWLPL